MIMSSSSQRGDFMPESTTPVSEQETARVSGGGSGAGQLLQHRLDLIEDLWKSVLRSECPPEQSERLLRLKQLSDPVSLEGRDGDSTSEAIVELIKAGPFGGHLSGPCLFALFPAHQHP